MKVRTTLPGAAAMVAVASMVLSPCARADGDTDFANQLHAYGIYGSRDDNAWIGKIACTRLATQLDDTAFESATFVKGNLARTTSTDQTWQFLGAAIVAYCPDQTAVLRAAAGFSGSPRREQT